MRERVAAIVERDGLLLMVRQRAKGPEGRHDGFEYLTLPAAASTKASRPSMPSRERWPRRSCLRVVSASFVRRVEHVEQPGGATSIFSVEVAEGSATLGVDPELTCDCPRLVGIERVPAPSRTAWDGVDVRSLLRVRITQSR